MEHTKFDYMVSAICPACEKRDTGCDHIGSFKADCPVANNQTEKTSNADKIRAMSDEELAEYLPIVFDLMCQPTEECMKIICNRGECANTIKCALKWLQSEAE